MECLREGDPAEWQHDLAARVAWLVVPVTLLSVSALWAPNCDWLRGAALFVVFAVLAIASFLFGLIKKG